MTFCSFSIKLHIQSLGEASLAMFKNKLILCFLKNTQHGVKIKDETTVILNGEGGEI